MKIKVFFLVLLLLQTIMQANAFQGQDYVIKGKVIDEKGNPLPGAGITIINTFYGAYTGPDGTYSIEVNKGGIYYVRFSFIGYEARLHEINLTGTGILNVILKPKMLMTEEVIVNGTRAGTRTPVAYVNVDKETITKQNSGQDIPYILSMTPSLVETSETGNGIGYTSFRIRGTDGSRINVTIDGIPLNDAESQQVFWVDLPDLASSVENIQVQRGVGTSSNGSGAFGASVNIQTESPESVPFGEMSATLGSYNTLKYNVMTGTGLLADRFAFQMRYSEQKSDGFIKRTGSNYRSAYLSGVFRTEKSRLKANVILGEEHTGISWWGVPEEMLSTDRRYNPAGKYIDKDGIVKFYDNESDNYKQNHYQFIYSLNLSKNIFMHTTLHYTKGEGYYEEYREDQPFSDYGLQPVILSDTALSFTDLIRQKWMSNNFYGVVYSLNIHKGKVETVFGGGLNFYSGDHFGRIIWMRNAGNTEKDRQWYFNDSGKGEYNFYAKMNYLLSEKISAFCDIQFRHIRYEMSGTDDDLRDISQLHKFDFLNPKAGLFFSVSPGQDLYFSFSVAHKEPTRSNYKDAAGDNKVTPHPETLFDTETGYNLRSEKTSLAFNLYGMMYKDQLVPTGELSNVGYPIMTNVSKSYRAGIEINGGLKPVNLIDWQLNMTLSRNKILDFTEYYVDYNTSDWTSEYKSKNLGTVDIAYSPSITGSSDLALVLSDKLKLHLIIKYVGEQYFDNTMNSNRMIDPYLVNNLRIDYNPQIQRVKNTEFQLLINNVFNNEYENNSYGGNWYEDGSEKTWAYYFPQAGINFMLRFGIKF